MILEFIIDICFASRRRLPYVWKHLCHLFVILAAKLLERRPGLGLFQKTDDLFFAES